MVSPIAFHLQETSIALGMFISLWGLAEFAPCLRDVLLGKHNTPSRSLCPYHAGGAMMCITLLLFGVARANTIGWLPIGHFFASILFIVSMVTSAMTIALGIWAKNQSMLLQHGLNPSLPALSRIFSMMLIVILAFALIGLVGVIDD